MGDWTEEIRRDERIYPPVHPGEVLRMEFLEPMGMTPDNLAGGSGVPAQRVRSLLVREEGTIAPILSCKAWPVLRYGRGSLQPRVQVCYGLQIEEDRREREAR